MRSPLRGALAVLVLTSSVSAHDAWLSGPATAVPGATVPFDLTSSGTFPAPDHAVEPSRVARALCRVAGQEAPLRAGSRKGRSLRLRGRELQAGVAACGLRLGPRTLDLEAKDVEHYLEEIGATGTIGARWKALPEPRAWRETYVKHAKTFTRLGSKDDPSWGEPLGLALEIVPLADPTRLRASTEVRPGVAKPSEWESDFATLYLSVAP